VLLNRRVIPRRARSGPCEAERRQADRRLPSKVDALLRAIGWAIVPHTSPVWIPTRTASVTPFAVETRIELSHCRDDAKRGAHRALGVILVGSWITEVHQEAIAEILRDVTAEANQSRRHRDTDTNARSRAELAGSSWPESLVDSTRSQNITVSWRRSASGELPGSWTSGVCPETGASGEPHLVQNLWVGGFWVPHWTQTDASLVPHSGQNSAPGGVSCWHRGHFITASDDGSRELILVQ
jgi:hypothetical protein